MSETNIIYSRIIDAYKYSIPKRIGAYIVTHTIDNIHVERYIGSTKNLFSRMYGHYNKKIISIDLYITDDISIAQSLERILMELLNPATNSIIPSLFDKDNGLMNELLRDTNIKEHVSNNVIKIGYRYLKYINKDEKHRMLINEDYIDIKQPKGLSMNHDVYQLIKVKQTELMGKTGKYFKMIDIVDMAIRSGIDNIGLDKDNRLSFIKI